MHDWPASFSALVLALRRRGITYHMLRDRAVARAHWPEPSSHNYVGYVLRRHWANLEDDPPEAETLARAIIDATIDALRATPPYANLGAPVTTTVPAPSREELC